MKKYLFSSLIFASILGGFSLLSPVFAADCTLSQDGNYYCANTDICKTTSCLCSSKTIYQGERCVTSTTAISVLHTPAYAISGSTVVLTFAIDNKGADALFVVDLLHTVPANVARVKVVDTDPLMLNNQATILLKNGLANPEYWVPANTVRTITITGTVVNQGFGFSPFTVNAYFLRGTTRSENTAFTIDPISEFTLQQKTITFPTRFGDTLEYQYTISNIGSLRGSVGGLTLSLPSTLFETPTLSRNGSTFTYEQIGLGNFVWKAISVPLDPGTSFTYVLRSRLAANLTPGTPISFTGSLYQPGFQISTGNDTSIVINSAPILVDIQAVSVDSSSTPEAVGDEVAFTVRYQASGNQNPQNLSLLASISGTTISNKTITLPALQTNTAGSIIVTGSVAAAYPARSQLCFSGTLSASNETGDPTNNTFSPRCVSLFGLPDATISARLVTPLDEISATAPLSFEVYVGNSGDANIPSLKTRFSSTNITLSTSELTLSNLAAGDGATRIITGVLSSFPAQGTAFTFSGNVALVSGREKTMSNNTFSLSTSLSGLADVALPRITQTFNGYRKNDEVRYTIAYGNSGYRTASGVQIALTLPSFVEGISSSLDLGALVPGSQNTLVLTGKITQNLAAYTAYTFSGRISTSTAQLSSANDSFSSGGVVPAAPLFDASFAGRNTTRGRNISSAGTVTALSGDALTFTFTITNRGNTSGDSFVITPNVIAGTLGFSQTSFTVPSLGIGQSIAFTLTGTVLRASFDRFPVVLGFQGGSDLPTQSYTIWVEEPFDCGDGIITKNEPCDTLGQIGVGSGEQCQEIDNLCVLSTVSISNTACIDVAGTQTCAPAVVVPLAAPSCTELTLKQKKSTPSSITATCVADSALLGTPVRIDCGNSTSVTGILNDSSIFEANCSYGSTAQAESARVSCAVAGNLTPACQNIMLAQCEVFTSPDVLLLKSGEKSEVNVTCKADDDESHNLVIDCNNERNQTFSKYTSTLKGTCSFSTDDFDSKDPSANITCRVDDASTCSTEIILDEPFFGVCGDGIKQGYEQCDLGDDGDRQQGTIWSWLDTEKTKRASDSQRGKTCTQFCAIKEGTDQTLPSCLSISNKNLSVQNGEYMPFWWRVLNANRKLNNSECNDSSDIGNIKDMRCSFEIQAPDGRIQSIIEDQDCTKRMNPIPTLFQPFSNELQNSFGNFVVDKEILSDIIGAKELYGEYKLRLSHVRYEYCKEEDTWEESQTDNVCETNFTITKPYVVQKSTFGATPKSTTINLDTFRTLNDEAILTRTDLDKIMVLDANDYAGGAKIKGMMREFAKSTEKFAKKIANDSLPATLRGLDVRKVPNKDIYMISSNTPHTKIELRDFASFKKAFTIITNNIDLTVNGDVTLNGMFVARNGFINFAGGCNQAQTVQGIFVSDQSFDSPIISNDSLSKSRCGAGGLYVKGVLIGDTSRLIKNRRSSLENWFMVSGDLDTQMVQRRNQIFDGAAVHIEYSPSLWQSLPPGADQFTKALDIYKK